MSKFPVLPLVVAGEDLWLLTRRDLALPLALRIGNTYAKKAANDPTLQEALRVSGLGDEALTLSFGVLFAKQGYPIDRQLELADELERNAKRHRRDRSLKEGCLDYHWLDSSARESVSEARDESWSVREPAGKTFRLFTRPWTLSELEKVKEAAIRLTTGPPTKGPEGKGGIPVARRKLQQLDVVLRLGDRLSYLAFQRWWAGLASEERKTLNDVYDLLPEKTRPAASTPSQGAAEAPVGPWTKDADPATVLLELVELGEILFCPSSQSNSDGDSPGRSTPEAA